MSSYNLNKTFEMNGKGYRTDSETLELLNVVVPMAKQSGDMSAVAAMMTLGEMGGRIIEIN